MVACFVAAKAMATTALARPTRYDSSASPLLEGWSKMISPIRRLERASAVLRLVCIPAFAWLVTACNGSSSSPTPAIDMQKVVAVAKITALRPPGAQSINSAAFLNGEIFTATAVELVKGGFCNHKNERMVVRFSARGSAKGPYPGSFTVSGNWGDSRGEYPSWWAIYESFTISSTKGSIRGLVMMRAGAPFGHMNCNHFGPIEGLETLIGPHERNVGTASVTSIGAKGLSEAFN
jgi:hypothetical protein